MVIFIFAFEFGRIVLDNKCLCLKADVNLKFYKKKS